MQIVQSVLPPDLHSHLRRVRERLPYMTFYLQPLAYSNQYELQVYYRNRLEYTFRARGHSMIRELQRLQKVPGVKTGV